MGFPSGISGKEPACQCRRLYIIDTGSIPGWEDPLEEGTATHSSFVAWRIPRTSEPGESHGRRKLEGYSSYGHKELDMTEET